MTKVKQAQVDAPDGFVPCPECDGACVVPGSRYTQLLTCSRCDGSGVVPAEKESAPAAVEALDA